ncbi:lipopolysaccharide biosynthesis protein [Microbacterium oleivorans]|uniref:lipopolysaccharide biosynthesis protein n=1 Tax=Microbacterium oleivorans TaxID=273677 RepID=UPI000766EA04|nr:hypothetical protein [Microbacterium oleivorans]
MKKIARLLAPLTSSVLLRLVQLLVMVVGAQLVGQEIRPSFIAAFSVVAAFGVFTDSGAATYLLASDAVGRRILALALRIQLVLSAGGLVAATLFSLLALPWADHMHGLLIVGSLAATQGIDSVTRVARSVRLRQGDDLGFAAGDGLSAVAKLAVVGGGLLAGSIYFVAILPIASLAVLLTMLVLAKRTPLVDSEATPRIRSVLQYGVAGALSGLYSQTPYLLATWMLPVEAVAVLSVILRVIQPMEIAPAVASQQLLPRIRRMSPQFWFVWWAVFAGGGLLLGAAIVVARTPLEILFDQNLTPLLVLSLMACTVPAKFGNYLLSALTLALGGVRSKITVSLCAGFVAVASSLVLLPLVGAPGAPVSMLASEAVLGGGLILAIRAAHRKAP